MLEPNPDQISSPDSSPRIGLTMADVLALPDLERQIINWIQRSQAQTGVTLADAIASLAQKDGIVQKDGIDERAISDAFDRLLEKGFIHAVTDIPETRYRVRLGSMRAQRPQSYWKRLNPEL